MDAATIGSRRTRAAAAALLVAAIGHAPGAAGIAAAQPAGPEAAPGWRVFSGAADASAVAFVDDRTIVVADDENNALRFYDATAGGAPRAEVDLSAFLGAGRGAEADIEAAARVGERIYWIGSHGRNRTGRLREERERFFATDIVRSPEGATVRPVGRPCTTLLGAMLAALGPSEAGSALTAATGADASGRRATRAPELAPARGGLNIEALAASADGETLFIGFRSPLVDRGGERRALVVPLLNPARVVEGAEPPRFGSPLAWDLGGGGLRDMTRLPGGGGYVLLAGPAGDRPGFVLYRWSGELAEAPRAWRAPAPDGFDGRPEALTPTPGAARLLVLSDDGGLPVAVAPGECRRGATRADGTCLNKQLADPARRTFRGFELSP